MTFLILLKHQQRNSTLTASIVPYIYMCVCVCVCVYVCMIVEYVIVEQVVTSPTIRHNEQINVSLTHTVTFLWRIGVTGSFSFGYA